MQDVMLTKLDPITHGQRIAAAAEFARTLLEAKIRRGHAPKLSKAERAAVVQRIAQYEAPLVQGGVNFSRLDIGTLLEHQRHGGKIEFETLGPYLTSYLPHGGTMTLDNLIPEDAIGLELAVVLRQLFPAARLVSLCDDYNANGPGGDWNLSGIGDFTETLKHTFKESLIRLFQAVDALTPDAVEHRDYVIISESSRIADAERLVNRLEALGHIVHKGQEIIFLNPEAENPLHHRMSLRSARGKWLCEALDAATFLKAENLDILHIVALPDYMKDQQDKVWEILRVLGMSPHQYHNIFYSLGHTPTAIAQTVRQAFTSHPLYHS